MSDQEIKGQEVLNINDNISILSTVKNIKTTAKPWLDSLLSQNYPSDFCILIIDGHSTDGTIDILNEYAERFSKIKIIEYQSTQPEALNYAIDSGYLSNKLIALIDGDCIATKDWLKTLVDTLNKECLVMRHPNMNLLIKKDLLEKLRFNEDLEVGYDADFGYRLNSAGYKLFYEPNAIVYHYHRSMIRGYLKQQFETGKYMTNFYINNKKAIRGDNINPIWMTTQPIFFSLFIFSLFLSIFYTSIIYIALIFLSMLIIDFSLGVYFASKKTKKLFVVSLYLLYVVRIVPWFCGAMVRLFQRRNT